METIIVGTLALILGGGIVFVIFKRRKTKVIEKEAVVLLEKVHAVCKLVTVEGDFSEIYDYHDKQTAFFGLLPQNKRALLIVKAKAFVGYDLTQINPEIDPKLKTITINNLPEPRIIAIDSDIKYYDIQQSAFNKFSTEELTLLNKEAKAQITRQIPNSGLLEMSQTQGLKTLELIEEITSALGWKVISKPLIEEKKKQLPPTKAIEH